MGESFPQLHKTKDLGQVLWSPLVCYSFNVLVSSLPLAQNRIALLCPLVVQVGHVISSGQ